MVKKYSDLNKKEQGKIDNVIDINANVLGFDSWSRSNGKLRILDGYGLCSKCNNFQFARSEFKTKLAKCSEFENFLSSEDPVSDCTNFEKRGSMSVDDMKLIAIIIEPKKNNIGY